MSSARSLLSCDLMQHDKKARKKVCPSEIGIAKAVRLIYLTQFFVLIQDTNLNLVYVPHYLPSQHVPYSTKQVQNARCTLSQLGETLY